MTRADIPDQAHLKEILSVDGAPPSIVLDIGGSADLNGDGLVEASLDEAGDLQFRDV